MRDSDSRTYRRVGVTVGTSTAVMGIVSLAIAVTTLPRSGPFCAEECLGYPYVGGVEFVPRDFIWMYPAIALVLLVVPLAAVLAPSDRAASPTTRFAGRVAVAFATIAAGVLAVDYGLQLAVVQPSLLAGEADGLSVLSQYNPHGIFIALEDVGYLVMGLAFLAMATLVGRGSRLERAIWWTFLAGGVLTPVLLVLLLALFGAGLEYRFEVYGLGLCWLVLIGAGAMLAVLSARDEDVSSLAPSALDE